MQSLSELGADPSATDAGSFAEVQRAFTANIRNPTDNPVPEAVPARRMLVYRNLIFNNLSSLLAEGFPTLRRCLGSDAWEAMIDDFLAHHRAKTPLFTRLGEELLDFLSHERQTGAGDPPYLLELAHYEWIQTWLYLRQAPADTEVTEPYGDLMDGVPVVSPLAVSLCYRFPVHRIAHQREAVNPKPTRLVLYRNHRDEVERLLVNQVTQRLLQLLDTETPRTGRTALRLIAEELQHPQPATVAEHGAALLSDLRRRRILLGTRGNIHEAPIDLY